MFLESQTQNIEILFSLQLSCGNYTLVTYKLSDCGKMCVTTNDAESKTSITVQMKLQQLLQDVEIQSK